MQTSPRLFVETPAALMSPMLAWKCPPPTPRLWSSSCVFRLRKSKPVGASFGPTPASNLGSLKKACGISFKVAGRSRALAWSLGVTRMCSCGLGWKPAACMRPVEAPTW
eukprot:CAMPEP_0197650588 /NCGR_PEP_ID=MMETSP1338-20131121/31037_1 /TAXON_ID=43686 ORGANISM="Pelagodinium beii, Strain RCC1491" /NCGR_SAMPLE_ID=MMETSP1338 /ASSEMBLY_ACC=CAM_ASM_000754 /LENGTH=108 /DNA_ID=CAMNT_0043225025 /DNA_START=228 /DNA_END=554 /DNA_ORIENTATION=-